MNVQIALANIWQT